jgi:hypothetical protein
MIESSRADLSPAAKAALEETEKLSTVDKFAVVLQLIADLAAAANRVSPPTGEKMDSGLSVEVAASNTVENATHGFSIVQDAAGNNAVKFSTAREDGTIATYWLPVGARGVSRDDLVQYGKENLNGAELKPHSELEEFVKQYVNPAVEGLLEIDGVLQTNDEALKLAHSLLQLGVRTANSNAYIAFDTENKSSGRAVSGGRVRDLALSRRDSDRRSICAFFGASFPESNN